MIYATFTVSGARSLLADDTYPARGRWSSAAVGRCRRAAEAPPNSGAEAAARALPSCVPAAWCARTPIPAFLFAMPTSRPRLLPRSYPQALVTIGDHLRKWRLDLGLLHRQVAERIGADASTLTNWELNRTSPALRFLPGIVQFLGYTPWTRDGSTGNQLLAYRRERGCPSQPLAHLVGVDPGTHSRWERGRRWPRHELPRAP